MSTFSYRNESQLFGSIESPRIKRASYIFHIDIGPTNQKYRGVQSCCDKSLMRPGVEFDLLLNTSLPLLRFNHNKYLKVSFENS